MTQQEKRLLLQDLCARLPYGLIVRHVKINKDFKINGGLCNDCDDGTTQLLLYVKTIDKGYQLLPTGPGDVLPYLRPLSSMTEEEKREYHEIDDCAYTCPEEYAHVPAVDRVDWLNAHHFDYRGLIEKGLAIEVTEENNPYV